MSNPIIVSPRTTGNLVQFNRGNNITRMNRTPSVDGGGLMGGPFTPVFASQWETALGNSGNAVTDGGLWNDAGYCGRDDIMEIVSGATLAVPIKLPVMLPVTLSDPVISSPLGKLINPPPVNEQLEVVAKLADNELLA